MKKQSTLKNILQVMMSNCSTILSGVFIGLLIPKIISVEGYGFYKTFTLYMTYVGIFHLGIADGIVLKYGGFDYDQLDRTKFRGFFQCYLLVHLFFAALFCICAIFIPNNNNKFILFMLAINMIVVNINTYFQQILQITQKFKEYSFPKILQDTTNILSIGLFYILYLHGFTISYTYYIIVVVSINCILTIWYLVNYKDIVFGNSQSLTTTKPEIVELIKNGFPLLFANLISTLILTLDRQFVNFLFDTTTYAIYSFAYDMLTLVTVATSAFAIVLYPTMKRTSLDHLKHIYKYLIETVLCFISFALLIFFPLKTFILWYLPNYASSLPIFRIIFPGLIITSAISIVMHNYYKTLGKNIIFFKKSLIVLLLSALANSIAYILFHTTIAISVASIIVMLFWYFYVEEYFVQIYEYKRWRRFIYILCMMSGFYLTTHLSSVFLGMMLYFIFYCLVTWCIFHKDFNTILTLFKNGR